MTIRTLSSVRRGYVSVILWLFVIACWFYAVGVVSQVFFIGMVFLVGQGQWLETHRAIGHSIGLLAILASLSALVARLPWSLLIAALALVLLHGLQYAFIEATGSSFLRAFHAVGAVLLFWLAAYLGQGGVEFLKRRVS